MTTQEHCENPFYPDLSKVLKTDMNGVDKRLADLMEFSPETGEIVDSEFTEVKEVVWTLTHRTKFIKLMSDTIHKLAKLNFAGTRVFWLMAGSVSIESHNKDYVYLGYTHCSNMAKSIGTKLPKDTYYKGIANLIENGVIAKSTRTNVFWLNISVLFNGNFSALPKIKDQDTIRKRLKEEGRRVTYCEKGADKC